MFAEHGREIADSLQWNSTADEERVALLFLAEALAVTNPPEAVDMLSCYDALTTPIDRGLLFNSDVRLWIVETHVRGLVHRIRGEWDAAWVSFKMTHDAARRVGFLWRATLTLIELDATPHARKPRGDSYLQAAALLVRDNFPRSFLARRLGRWMNVYRDPVAKGLAPQPRQVLRHLLAAKSTDEIARTMSIGEGTVRNYIKELFRRFEVRSREELLVACYERGMGSPLWWDTLDKPNPPSIAGARPFVPPGAARRPRRS